MVLQTTLDDSWSSHFASVEGESCDDEGLLGDVKSVEHFNCFSFFFFHFIFGFVVESLYL